ncbi:ABC transporter ATP-binding protein [Natronogracilivirga saccharolytica]|uniref:ABC transporter ATP-binding protein n=1 Tax=Natronogracilivirga saccharolytica TaxID=2812953 RepID=UPI001FEAD802|nr:ABC transporter ATP-binding protein [Natronogracilivirga saccharolytica]
MTSTASDKRSGNNKSAQGKAVDSYLIRRLYYFLAPYKWFMVLALVLTLSVAFLGPLRPYLTQIAVDDYIADRDAGGLARLMLLYLGVLMLETIILIGNTYLMRWVGQGALFRLRNAVFEKIQNLHVQFFDKNPIGRLITRTTSDIEALNDLLSTGVVNIIGDLFRIVFIIGFMLSMSWELSIVSLSVLPVLVYATFWFKAKVRVAFLNVRDQIARLHSFIQEHINGMNIVQLFGRGEKEAEKFASINKDHTDAHIRTIFYFALFWPAVEVIASLAMALVIWYGGAQALSGQVTFGVLLAFIQYVRQFFVPIRDLSEKFNTLQSALASSERIFGVLDTENEITDAEHPVTPAKQDGHIRFEDVSFRYNENETEGDVLKNASFEVRPGEVVAIVGATGAGKTTIINLLMRFYDVSAGRITIDGVDIRQMSQSCLRSYFGLVLQDNLLFEGTIMDNITLGNNDITREQVMQASQAVQADRFIRKLPGGYMHRIAERGASLSMGQRQLICFVRAIVFDPKVLVLDEATSNVDSETEYLVSRALDSIMEGRTTLVIAHRLSTIQHADNILVMHKGRIRETGTHEQLLAKTDGIYRRLYELQYRDQKVNPLT